MPRAPSIGRARRHGQNHSRQVGTTASTNAGEHLAAKDNVPDEGIWYIPFYKVDRVDTFQLDAANRFATGAMAFTDRDFCDFWQVRFLDFGGASGSTMTVYINGPRGTGAANPPTIVGTVFNQQGQPINHFDIRTSQYSLEIPLLGLVEDDDTRFGSIELILNATGNPGGVVSVVHSAFGRFSVGIEGVCKD